MMRMHEPKAKLTERNRLDEDHEVDLTHKKRETPPIKPIVTGDVEALLIALACSNPPDGYARWTLRLLEKKVVELVSWKKYPTTP